MSERTNDTSIPLHPERNVRELVAGYLGQAADFYRGTSRWTKGTLLAVQAIGLGLLTSCGGDLANPSFLHLGQGPKVELAGQNAALKELTADEKLMLSRTIEIMDQFINLDAGSFDYLHTFVSESGQVPADLIHSTTYKKNTGGSLSIMELYQSAQAKKNQAAVLRAEFHTNSQGQKVSEKYRIGISDTGQFVADEPVPYTPKRFLSEDPTTGQIIEMDEEALGPEPIEVTFIDATNKAQRLVKGAEVIPAWNEYQNQSDNRYVDAVSSSDMKQPDGTTVRIIVYSSGIVEFEVTYPYKADPIKRLPLPGQGSTALLPRSTMSSIVAI